jgi:hypothetical protein
LVERFDSGESGVVIAETGVNWYPMMICRGEQYLPRPYVADFTSVKEAALKSSLATDLGVNVTQIAVTVTAARRRLLAGVTVAGRCRCRLTVLKYQDPC